MSEEILYSMGQIPDEMIAEAMNSSGNRHRMILRRTAAIAASICLIVTGIVAAVIYRNSQVTATNENIMAGGPALFVYYEGHYYFYRGYYDKALPEGYEYAGQTNNIGMNTPEHNLDSNKYGRIYVNETVPDVIYFRWNSWDEEFEEKPEPYLILRLEELFEK